MIKKIALIFTITTLLFACNSTKKMTQEKQNPQTNFVNVTKLVDYDEFEKIKDFVLQNGDQRTYRNFDNNNPHYQFEICDIFLGADIGQKNINNNPELSDFNQLTMTDWDSDIRYHELIMVRKGDLKAGKAWIREGMEEEQVYLVDVYGKGLVTMENKLPAYLKQIRKEIKAAKK